MVRLLFILLFFSQAQAQVGGIESKIWLNQRLGHGVPFLSGSLSYESNSIGEPSIVPDSGGVKIYYTANNGSNQFAIALATADSMEGTLTKRGVMFGNGTVVSRFANCSKVFKLGSTYYAYAVNGYGSGSTYLYTSSNGYAWSDQGVIFSTALIPSLVGYGNIGFVCDTTNVPVLLGGKYHAIVEGNEGFQWRLYHLESTSLTSGWTYVGRLDGLQEGSGSFSRASTTYLDSVYHIFYHYSSTGTLPTYGAYATSTDLSTFTKREVPFKTLESLPFGAFNAANLTIGTNQLADITVQQVYGKVYMLADYVRNSSPTLCVIYRWNFHGAFNELITGLHSCIGCVGVYP